MPDAIHFVRVSHARRPLHPITAASRDELSAELDHQAERLKVARRTTPATTRNEIITYTAQIAGCRPEHVTYYDETAPELVRDLLAMGRLQADYERAMIARAGLLRKGAYVGLSYTLLAELTGLTRTTVNYHINQETSHDHG